MKAAMMGGFILGTAVGAAIGVGVALMMAPRSGEELRAQLQDDTTVQIERLRTQMNELAEQIKAFLQTKENNQAIAGDQDTTEDTELA